MNHDMIPHQPSGGLSLPWAWCQRCQRTYTPGACRVVRFASDALHPHPATLYLCPYRDCSASTEQSGWLWATLRLEHQEYPTIPERNDVYAR